MKSGLHCGRSIPGIRRRNPSLASAILLMLLSGVAVPALSQPAPIPASVTPKFAIKGFKVSGENPLGEAATSKVLAPFQKTDATIDTLQQATSALEAALRDRGFGLHRVALPPQEISDVVALNIVKFSIGKVTIEGRARYNDANIRRSVPELREGNTPNFRQLAVQTSIANENPGKQITVSLKESDEPDKIDAAIKVAEAKPWSFTVALANTGSQASGRDRLTFSGGYANLFNRDHHFVGAYTTSLEKGNDVKQIGLSYRAPMYVAGGMLGLSLTKSDVVGNFGAFNSTGAGRTMGINYTHHLPPEGGYRGYISAGLDDKVFNITKINGIPVPGQVDRRTRPISLGYNAKVETDSTVWGYNAEFAANIGGGSGNDLASYVTEDPRVTTSHWKAVRAGANYAATFAGNWLWSVRGQVQFSSDALISGEQFGLGGAASVRGTGERVISGDRGLAASLEVTTPELSNGLRMLGFVDAGWLGNNSPNATTKPASDRLGSVGLGLRYSSPKDGFALSADYGRIVSGSVVPLTVNTSAPKNGDEKVHLNLSVRF